MLFNMVCQMCDHEGNLCDRCKMNEGDYQEPEVEGLEEYREKEKLREMGLTPVDELISPGHCPIAEPTVITNDDY